MSEASSAAPHLSQWLALPTELSPPPIRGKIVFRETSPWCQKGWGPLIYKIMSSTNRDSFNVFLSSVYSFYFSCLIALARISHAILNRSGENRYLCLVWFFFLPSRYLREKALILLPLSMMLVVDFFRCPLSG